MSLSHAVLTGVLALSLRGGPPQEAEEASGASQLHTFGSYVVRLENPGEEPRVQLRRRAFPELLDLEYRFDQRLRIEAAGAENALAQTTDYPLLGIRFGARTEAAQDGAVHCSIEVLDAVHAEEPGTPPVVLRDIGDQIEALRGLRLSWDVDTTGAVLESQARLAGNLSRPDLSMVLMDELALDWSLAFPDEAVGVGAVWTCRGDLPVRMVDPRFKADTTLTLRVTEIVDGDVHLEVGLSRAPADLGNKPGEMASAENYACEGSGQVVVDLSKGVVTNSRMQRAIDAYVPVGNTGRAMNLHLEIVTVVVPRDQLPESARVGADPVPADDPEEGE